ncbi:MAG: tRNA pseudouridine(38-40) synthase TruA [Candidatus Eremiobacteraeota bacterium]|nr:tRNA pseudouridine(38-40) synthase TruA [Candidatus Eremiobacteraeota bacterium]
MSSISTRSDPFRNGRTRSALTTYRLVVEYDGTEFHGFQVQPGIRTVGGELEGALCALFHTQIALAAAGRTDAGVHASGQVVSFKSERDFPVGRLALALNSALPPDLSVREAALVEDGFSARFDAHERIYEYLILNRTMPSALTARWAHHVHRPLDDALLATAAQDLVGHHDFVAFCGVLPDFGGTARTLNAVEVERDGELVRIRLRAESFLHRMVRVAVGTLVEIATGRRDPADIPRILNGRDRREAGYTAPAAGLFLAGVRYAGFDSYARPTLAYVGS